MEIELLVFFLVVSLAGLAFLAVVMFPEIILERLNWRNVEVAFNILGLGILISICFGNILTFYRLLTGRTIVVVEQNPIVATVEFTFVVIGFFYVVYLLLKFFRDLGRRIGRS